MNERERTARMQVEQALYEQMFVDPKFSEDAFNDDGRAVDRAAESRLDR